MVVEDGILTCPAGRRIAYLAPPGTCPGAPTGLVEPFATLYTCRLFAQPGPLRPAGHTADTADFFAMALFLQFMAQEWILFAALGVVVVMLFVHEGRRSGPSVSPQQAINLVNGEQGVFVDLRDAADYKQGHIVEAVHIPAAKMAERMVELEKYKQRPVILVCKMGQQAAAAGKQLKAGGFEKVYKMTGGMMEWGNLQLPTVSRS